VIVCALEGSSEIKSWLGDLCSKTKQLSRLYAPVGKSVISFRWKPVPLDFKDWVVKHKDVQIEPSHIVDDSMIVINNTCTRPVLLPDFVENVEPITPSSSQMNQQYENENASKTRENDNVSESDEDQPNESLSDDTTLESDEEKQNENTSKTTLESDEIDNYELQVAAWNWYRSNLLSFDRDPHKEFFCRLILCCVMRENSIERLQIRNLIINSIDNSVCAVSAT
jgi:hypothetical protein